MIIYSEKFTTISIALTLLLCVICSTTFANEQQLLSVQNYGHPDAITDEYIITFSATTRSKQTAVAAVQAEIIANDGMIKREFQTFSGLAVRMNADTLQSVRANPNVEAIEANLAVMVADEVESWGLDRIDDRDLPLDGTYEYNTDGTGITAYILDSGIRATHEQFEDRVVDGFTVVDDGYGWSDCNGHGTHVAGIVGGKTVGVAPGVDLVSVRILDCYNSAQLDVIVAGVEWVAQNAIHPAVANMSISFNTTSETLDNAVRIMANRGVIVANSAGNRSGADACRFSPQPVEEIITVGSTDDDDQVSTFSNLGTCVDIFAPGRDIISASKDDDVSTTSKLGTSMSTPHVTGCAARYMEQFPGSILADVVGALTGDTPSASDEPDSASIGDSYTDSDSGVATGDGNEIDRILLVASENILTGDLNDAPNRLLYCNFDDLDSTPPPSPTPPDENIIYAENFDTNDNGWTVNPNGTDTATSGVWEVDTAEATYSEAGLPFQTSTEDVLVTGALAGSNAEANDVDGGTTSIQSPPILIPSGDNTFLSLDYYLAHADNATNGDSLIITLVGTSNSQTAVRELGGANEDYGQWRTSYISLGLFKGDTIRILITTTDSGAPSLIEAAVDNIQISLPSGTFADDITPSTPNTSTLPDNDSLSVGDAIIEEQIEEIGLIPTSVSLTGQDAMSALPLWLALFIVPLGVATAVSKQ